MSREDRDLFYLHLRSIFKYRNRNACELTLKSSNGRPVRVHVESRYDIHPKGRAECRSVVTDLTDIKRTEMELQQALAENRHHLVRMNALFHQMTEGLFIFDDRGNLVEINNAALDLWGYESTSSLLRPHRELIRLFEVFDLEGQPLPISWWPFLRVLSGEVIRDYQVRVHCRETGRSFIGSYSGTPVLDSEGRTMLSIVTLRDITVQYQASAQLQKSRKSLKQMNETLEARVAERTAEVQRMADRLRGLAAEMSRVEQRERKRIAGILHDHLQQILAAARLHMERARQEKSLEKARSLMERVYDLIRESIDISRSLSVELSPPVLNESGLAAGLRWLAGRMKEQREFRVAVHNEGTVDPLPEEIRFFLFESVRELLFNAIKHAGTDEASVSLKRDMDGQVRITVEDRGHGFHAAALEERAAEDVTFGLFSIRERMTYLGGTMNIESEPGKGCRVTLAVPVGTPTGTETAAPSPGHPHDSPPADTEDTSGRIRILIVDDHMIMRQGIKDVLSDETGIHIVGEAGDGEEAIMLADRLHPDIILMDVNLPRTSGIEATRIIRQRHPDISIIGLSMHVDEGVSSAMTEAGAAAYLTKDRAPEELVSTIESVFR